jgi:hypothetical protein
VGPTCHCIIESRAPSNFAHSQLSFGGGGSTPAGQAPHPHTSALLARSGCPALLPTCCCSGRPPRLPRNSVPLPPASYPVPAPASHPTRAPAPRSLRCYCSLTCAWFVTGREREDNRGNPAAPRGNGVYRAHGLVKDEEQGLSFSDSDGEQMGMTSLLEAGFMTFAKN